MFPPKYVIGRTKQFFFCNILDPKCMFWESKQTGKDFFIKIRQKIL